MAAFSFDAPSKGAGQDLLRILFVIFAFFGVPVFVVYRIRKKRSMKEGEKESRLWSFLRTMAITIFFGMVLLIMLNIAYVMLFHKSP